MKVYKAISCANLYESGKLRVSTRHDYAILRKTVLRQTSLEIRLETTPWCPEDYGIGDNRELGVIVYGVTLQAPRPGEE